MTVPLIELRNVCRRYAASSVSVAALQDVNLVIEAGEFVAVMGPSGSGKTTLMNVIGCLDQPSSGEYYFRGRPVHAARPDELARLRRDVFGFVFQDYNLLGMATARENVEMPAIYAGTPKNDRLARAGNLLSRLGLAHRLGHRPGELSGGEQQRVAIARALMNGGGVVLADEPTGSLDSRSGREIMAQLKSLSERGHTIILVTHDPGVASYAHRRIELLDGRVVSDGGSGSRSASGTASDAVIRSRRRETPTPAPVLLLRDGVLTAMRAFRSNKLRTALTLLGIIIGVLSVTAMLGLAEGVQRRIMDSFRQLGGANLTIRPAYDEEGPSPTLTLADAEAILDEVPNLISVAPEMTGNGEFVANDRQEWAPIVATTARSMQDRRWTLAQGVFFSDAENRNLEPVVVLGGMLAGNLFGEGGNPLGEHVLISGSPFQVIGVLKRSADPLAAYASGANAAVVPLQTGAIRLLDREHLDSVGVFGRGDPPGRSRTAGNRHLTHPASWKTRLSDPEPEGGVGSPGQRLQYPENAVRHDRRYLARRCRNRGDEHHARNGCRAHPGDRSAHGHGRATA